MNHVPVMTKELIEHLAPKDGGVYIDGSFGGGGHARAVLEKADSMVFAIDKDEDAIKRGESLLSDFPERLVLIHGRFSDLQKHLAARSITHIDGISFDAGISSFQLEDGDRGFSYKKDGELDMRMDNENGISAKDYINSLSEAELTRIIYIYGEEKFSRPIARAIVKARNVKPITRTSELVDIILSVRSQRYNDKIHPATRTFQALRIFVNDELEELTQALNAAEMVLGANGRLVIISFHSLEDRIVKRFFKSRNLQNEAGISRFLPLRAQSPKPPSFEILTKSPLRPSKAEISKNPRARSAKLRAGIRTKALAQAPIESMKVL